MNLTYSIERGTNPKFFPYAVGVCSKRAPKCAMLKPNNDFSAKQKLQSRKWAWEWEFPLFSHPQIIQCHDLYYCISSNDVWATWMASFSSLQGHRVLNAADMLMYNIDQQTIIATVTVEHTRNNDNTTATTTTTLSMTSTPTRDSKHFRWEGMKATCCHCTVCTTWWSQKEMSDGDGRRAAAEMKQKTMHSVHMERQLEVCSGCQFNQINGQSLLFYLESVELCKRKASFQVGAANTAS